MELGLLGFDLADVLSGDVEGLVRHVGVCMIRKRVALAALPLNVRWGQFIRFLSHGGPGSTKQNLRDTEGFPWTFCVFAIVAVRPPIRHSWVANQRNVDLSKLVCHLETSREVDEKPAIV